MDDFTNPEILDSLQDELRTGNRIIEASGRKRKMWLGETSSAYGGGAEGLSDAYVAAFMLVLCVNQYSICPSSTHVP